MSIEELKELKAHYEEIVTHYSIVREPKLYTYWIKKVYEVEDKIKEQENDEQDGTTK